MATAPRPPGSPPGVAPTEQFMALANELVDFVLGEDKRYREAAGTTHIAATDQERKESLVYEVANKIKAMIPAPPSSPPTA